MTPLSGSGDAIASICTSVAPQGLVVSWNIDWAEPKLPECVVRYDIEPFCDNLVRLTITEEPRRRSRRSLEGGRKGWPMILSGVKSLLETGARSGCRCGSRPRRPVHKRNAASIPCESRSRFARRRGDHERGCQAETADILRRPGSRSESRLRSSHRPRVRPRGGE
jgi:hypothetical protein